MKVLLDTHFIIWLTHGSSKITPAVTEILADDRMEIHASAASFWELTIKTLKGKLTLPLSPSQMAEYMERAGARHLDVTHIHANTELRVGAATSDPFDRLLLAQCQVEDMRLLTLDRSLLPHPLAFRV